MAFSLVITVTCLTRRPSSTSRWSTGLGEVVKMAGVQRVGGKGKGMDRSGASGEGGWVRAPEALRQHGECGKLWVHPQSCSSQCSSITRLHHLAQSASPPKTAGVLFVDNVLYYISPKALSVQVYAWSFSWRGLSSSSPRPPVHLLPGGLPDFHPAILDGNGHYGLQFHPGW